MSRFKYLGGIIPFTFALYFLIVTVIALIYNYTDIGRKTRFRKLSQYHHQQQQQQQQQKDGDESTFFSRCLREIREYSIGFSFESVYRCAWRRSNCLNDVSGIYLLAIWRLMNFCFFFGIGFLWNYARGAGGFYYTNWNINLISLYYFLVTVASAIGIVHHNNFLQVYYLNKSRNSRNADNASGGHMQSEVYWSEHMQNFGYAIQILYEITGSAAFFITVVAYSSLSHSMKMWNVTKHLVTSLSLICELLLTSMTVRWEHVLFNVTWALMYLIFIWPYIACGERNSWPYFFLETDNASIFPWYVGLFVLVILFYYIFWLFSYVKELLIGHIEHKYLHVTIEEEDGNGEGDQSQGHAQAEKSHELVKV